MKAGRGLDILISEKFFGAEPGYYDESTLKSPLPYSTSIEAAWQVVEKLKERRQIEIQCHHAFKVSIFNSVASVREPEAFYAMEKSAPHAICLAALEAIKKEKP